MVNSRSQVPPSVARCSGLQATAESGSEVGSLWVRMVRISEEKIFIFMCADLFLVLNRLGSVFSTEMYSTSNVGY